MRSLRQPFVSSTLKLLACGLLIVVLHSSLTTRPEASSVPKPGSNLIRIWIVGSPHTGDLPPATVPSKFRSEAERLGFTIEVETFRAIGFAAKFRQAIQTHTEPEVLTFNNFGVLVGIRTALGRFEGVASELQTTSDLVSVHESFASLQPRGWVVLVRSAINYDAARTLSIRQPVCPVEPGPLVASPPLRQATEAATFAARAYLACDRSTLSAASDDSRLGQKCFLPESDTQVESVKPCRVSGNRNLAFVSLVSSFSAQSREPVNIREAVYSTTLGHQSILALLRNQGGAWRLLAITDDPMNTVAPMPLTRHTLDKLLDDGGTAGITPEPAQLRTPDGIYPRPEKGERFGDFIWEPSKSTDVVGQVVEFLMGKETRQGRTRLFFLPAREGKLSSGHLMSGPSVWRVWSVSKSGDIAFSREHSYPH